MVDGDCFARVGFHPPIKRSAVLGLEQSHGHVERLHARVSRTIPMLLAISTALSEM